MANKKISEYPLVTSLSGNDLILVSKALSGGGYESNSVEVSSAFTDKLAKSDFESYSGSVNTSINSLSSKLEISDFESYSGEAFHNATLSGATTVEKIVQTITPMNAQALDGSLGNVFTRTLAGSETFTQSGFSAGQYFTVEVKQGTGTAYTVTWFSTITWRTSDGNAPVQTVVSDGLTTYAFRCTGSNTFDGYLVTGVAASAGGVSSVVAVTANYDVLSGDNGKTFSNFGLTGDVIFTLPSRADVLGDAFEVAFLNEYTALQDTVSGLQHLYNFENSMVDNKGNLTLTANSTTYDAVVKKTGVASLQFNGSATASFPHTADFWDTFANSWTFSTWVNLSESSSGAELAILDKPAESHGGTYYQIRIQGNATNSRYEAVLFKSNAYAVYLRCDGTTNSLVLGTWQHVAVTWNSSTTTLSLYVDGVLDNSANTPTGSYTNYEHGGALGGLYNTPGLQITGNLDDVCLYNRDLSVEEINIVKAGGVCSMIIHPASTDKLPGAIAAHSSIKSSSKSDYIKLKTGKSTTDIYATNVYPASTAWVDQLD